MALTCTIVSEFIKVIVAFSWTAPKKGAMGGLPARVFLATGDALVPMYVGTSGTQLLKNTLLDGLS